MERFDAPWDAGLKISTWLLVAIMGGATALLGGLGLAISHGDPSLGWPLFIAPAVLPVILLATWSLAPRGYAIERGELVVERPLFPIRIPLRDIRAVGRLPSPPRLGLRVAGTSGLFGHYGRFWSPALGAYRLYATRRDGLVSVETAAARFVLTPEPIDPFVRALLARSPHARPGAATGAAGARPRMGWKIAAGVGGLVLLLVAGILGAIWGFAPRDAVLDEEGVVIERRWAGPVTLPYGSIQDAEVLAAGYARGWWRENGTSLGPVRYGRFASRALGRFRLYAWREGPFVLLETDEGRVVLTPDEPEAFVEALGGRIGR
ncbi:MAG TPA: PH domain-containing protein [Anaeromyxobacteraceae bacterium]|nr:PH domain-containing protein [Anaeromyxobacteraceae bacterium]